mmetsp:Transcript_64100/g.177125  ORF Transcript_64100/g.177125 Transcript_64100/m.177125 type:complete len:232 (+) Transcript_64100:217-912(+)
MTVSSKGSSEIGPNSRRRPNSFMGEGPFEGLRRVGLMGNRRGDDGRLGLILKLLSPPPTEGDESARGCLNAPLPSAMEGEDDGGDDGDRDGDGHGVLAWSSAASKAESTLDEETRSSGAEKSSSSESTSSTMEAHRRRRSPPSLSVDRVDSPEPRSSLSRSASLIVCTCAKFRTTFLTLRFSFSDSPSVMHIRPITATACVAWSESGCLAASFMPGTNTPRPRLLTLSSSR